jgi:phosphatidylserine/phosphatidylglycerophosphate/cardiolipin synthase-like enzyme
MNHPTPQRTLVVQPDDGIEPVLGLIGDATKSLRVKQFTLSEPRLVQGLIDAHRCGVAVRVMLNPQRSSGDHPNDAVFGQLQQTGVAVQWTSPDFAVTHEKSIVVDDSRALVATFNLVLKYFTETRDYGVITADPAQVAQVAAGFDADWERVPFRPDVRPGLLWSVTNARPLMAQFIDRARHSLDIQHPKYVDATIVERLLAAHERGVHVRVLCGGRHGLSDYDILDTFASLRILQRAGIRVHRQKHLKLHAKLILADGRAALLGSMNIDRSAFDLRRELGIKVDDEPIVARLSHIFAHEWDHSHRYEVPDPLEAEKPADEELPHDPEFIHE